MWSQLASLASQVSETVAPVAQEFREALREDDDLKKQSETEPKSKTVQAQQPTRPARVGGGWLASVVSGTVAELRDALRDSDVEENNEDEVVEHEPLENVDSSLMEEKQASETPIEEGETDVNLRTHGSFLQEDETGETRDVHSEDTVELSTSEGISGDSPPRERINPAILTPIRNIWGVVSSVKGALDEFQEALREDSDSEDRSSEKALVSNAADAVTKLLEEQDNNEEAPVDTIAVDNKYSRSDLTRETPLSGRQVPTEEERQEEVIARKGLDVVRTRAVDVEVFDDVHLQGRTVEASFVHSSDNNGSVSIVDGSFSYVDTANGELVGFGEVIAVQASTISTGLPIKDDMDGGEGPVVEQLEENPSNRAPMSEEQDSLASGGWNPAEEPPTELLATSEGSSELFAFNGAAIPVGSQSDVLASTHSSSSSSAMPDEAPATPSTSSAQSPREGSVRNDRSRGKGGNRRRGPKQTHASPIPEAVSLPIEASSTADVLIEPVVLLAQDVLSPAEETLSTNNEPDLAIEKTAPAARANADVTEEASSLQSSKLPSPKATQGMTGSNKGKGSGSKRKGRRGSVQISSPQLVVQSGDAVKEPSPQPVVQSGDAVNEATKTVVEEETATKTLSVDAESEQTHPEDSVSNANVPDLEGPSPTVPSSDPAVKDQMDNERDNGEEEQVSTDIEATTMREYSPSGIESASSSTHVESTLESEPISRELNDASHPIPNPSSPTATSEVSSNKAEKPKSGRGTRRSKGGSGGTKKGSPRDSVRKEVAESARLVSESSRGGIPLPVQENDTGIRNGNPVEAEQVQELHGRMMTVEPVHVFERQKTEAELEPSETKDSLAVDCSVVEQQLSESRGTQGLSGSDLQILQDELKAVNARLEESESIRKVMEGDVTRLTTERNRVEEALARRVADEEVRRRSVEESISRLVEDNTRLQTLLSSSASSQQQVESHHLQTLEEERRLRLQAESKASTAAIELQKMLLEERSQFQKAEEKLGELVNTLRGQLDQQTASFEAQVKDLQTALEDKTRSVEKQKETNRAVVEKAYETEQALRQELEFSMEGAKDLRKELDQTRSGFEQYVQDLRGEMASRESELENTKREVQRLKGTQEDLEVALKENDELRRQLQDQTSRKDLERALEEVALLRGEAGREASVHLQRIQALETELQARRSDALMLRNDNAAMMAELDKTKRALMRTTQELERTESAHRQKVVQLRAELVKTNDEMEQQLNSANEKHDELKQELMRMKEEFTQTQQALAVAQSAVSIKRESGASHDSVDMQIVNQLVLAFVKRGRDSGDHGRREVIETMAGMFGWTEAQKSEVLGTYQPSTSSGVVSRGLDLFLSSATAKPASEKDLTTSSTTASSTFQPQRRRAVPSLTTDAAAKLLEKESFEDIFFKEFLSKEASPADAAGKRRSTSTKAADPQPATPLSSRSLKQQQSPLASPSAATSNAPLMFSSVLAEELEEPFPEPPVLMPLPAQLSESVEDSKEQMPK